MIKTEVREFRQGTESEVGLLEHPESPFLVEKRNQQGGEGSALPKAEGRRGRIEAQGQDFYKSEGERQIAWLLKSRGIRFHYEHPLAVVDRGKTRIWYPDFFLPEYGMVIEYIGMTGDSHYQKGVERKRDCYQAMGLPAILLDKEYFTGYWPGRLFSQIEDKLAHALSRFQEKVEAFEGKRA